LRGALMSSVNPGANIGGGKIVHFYKTVHVLGEVAAPAGIYGGSSLRPERPLLLQSFCPCFSPVCSASIRHVL
jgi:hypothetical protein